MLRKLRIALTVLSLTACLLTLALWVRSWSRLDRLDAPIDQFSPGSTIAVASVGGVIMLGVQQKMHGVDQDPRLAWRLISGPIDQVAIGQIDYGNLGFKVISEKRERGMQLPHWFAVTMLAACSLVPWIRFRQRFSLRTLLIAITLIAVAFGIFAVSS